MFLQCDRLADRLFATYLEEKSFFFALQGKKKARKVPETQSFVYKSNQINIFKVQIFLELLSSLWYFFCLKVFTEGKQHTYFPNGQWLFRLFFPRL